MMNNRHFYIFSLILTLSFSLFAESSGTGSPQKIACVGDSLTYGFGLVQREKYSYPSQLEKRLSSDYEIRNFGINGACATPGNRDFYLNNNVKEIVDWNPDILLVMLGSNDSKESVWISEELYLSGLVGIIEAVRGCNTSVVLVTPPPCRPNPYGIRDSVIREKILPSLEILSAREGYPLIDVYSALDKSQNLFIDNIHLSRKGYARLSDRLAAYLIN